MTTARKNPSRHSLVVGHVWASSNSQWVKMVWMIFHGVGRMASFTSNAMTMTCQITSNSSAIAIGPTDWFAKARILLSPFLSAISFL